MSDAGKDDKQKRNRVIAQNEAERQTTGDIRVSAWAIVFAVIAGCAAAAAATSRAASAARGRNRLFMRVSRRDHVQHRRFVQRTAWIFAAGLAVAHDDDAVAAAQYFRQLG